jgi:hypothetical protein
LIIRYLIAPLAATALTLSVGQVLAQGAFPAPLPAQMQANDPAFPPVNGSKAVRNDPAFPPVNGADSAFPPVNGAPKASVGAPPASPFPSAGAPAFGGGGGFQRPMAAAPQAGTADRCQKEFVPLREEAERRAKMIKAASDHHATPIEACKLFAAFGAAEIKMIKYIEVHSADCGIPAQVAEQLKANHKGTEGVQAKVCKVAEQMKQRGPAAPQLSDVLGSSAALPEANTEKKGGSAFDTLTGNVLTR